MKADFLSMYQIIMILLWAISSVFSFGIFWFVRAIKIENKLAIVEIAKDLSAEMKTREKECFRHEEDRNKLFELATQNVVAITTAIDQISSMKDLCKVNHRFDRGGNELR